jgi:glycosyltransferase involved in cell wall biosynthesis
LKILLISLGPVPHTTNSIVEGGGLRVWGLANALWGSGHEVSIAVSSAYLPAEFVCKNGIKLFPYSRIEDLEQPIVSSAAVVYPTGAPHLANSVLAYRSPFTICIGDSYVPIHVEVAARGSKDKELEEHHFRSVSPQWLSGIGRSDILLCASEDQRAYLMGLLAGSGYLTPSTYEHLKIAVVPFGLDSTQRSALNQLNGTKSKKEIKILWYGGFYPWFDGSKFAELATLLMDRYENTNLKVKIIVVGATNPFVTDPSFKKYADGIISNLKELSSVEFVDWLPYNKRHLLLSKVDLVFCFSQPGLENLVSWRTRYLDFIKFHIPVITNNLDPLGKMIVESGSGLCMDTNNLPQIVKAVEKIIENPKKLQKMKDSYSELEKSLNWMEVIQPLLVELNKPLKEIIWQDYNSKMIQNVPKVNFFSYAKYFGLQVDAHGWRETLKKTISFARKRILTRRFASNSTNIKVKPDYILFAHQLNYSGSPKIAIELVKDLRFDNRTNQNKEITIYSLGGIEEKVKGDFHKRGIKYVQTSFSPELLATDVPIIINGLAFPHELFDHLLLQIKTFSVPPLILVHEDRPEMYLDKRRAVTIGNAASAGLLRIVAPSKGTQSSIRNFFDTNSVERALYPSDSIQRFSYDFSEELCIHLTGTTGDRRKNHLHSIDLINQVVRVVEKDPGRYRKIKLVLIGVDENSTVGKLVFEQSKLIRDYVEIHPPLDFEECFEIMKKCNTVLCLSDYEALPLFVTQSMGLGQIVIRNSCSGLDEQLKENVNGIKVDYFAEYSESIAKILKLLDKTLTTSAALEAMGRQSHLMAKPQMGLEYKTHYQIS